MLTSSLVFSSLLSLPSTLSSTTNSHVLNVVRLVESINNFHVNHHHHSISRPSWRKFLPKWYILVSATSLVFSSLLPLSFMDPSNTNPHVLNVVRHVKSKNNFHVNHHHHSISRPSWRKFQLMWYILMSGTSLVFSFLLSLPSMVSSTAKSHVLNVVRDIGHVESIKKLPGKPPLPQHIRS